MIFKLKEKGFLLVDLLVGMGIFSAVIVLVIGIFLGGLNTQKRIYNKLYLQSEGNFLMQKISKEVRMLTNINSSEENANGSSIEFHNYNLELIKYCQSDSSGNCSSGGGYLARNGKILTSSETIVESFKIYTSKTFTNTQPLITVILKIKSKDPNSDSLTLQNSLVARSYN